MVDEQKKEQSEQAQEEEVTMGERDKAKSMFETNDTVPEIEIDANRNSMETGSAETGSIEIDITSGADYGSPESMNEVETGVAGESPSTESETVVEENVKAIEVSEPTKEEKKVPDDFEEYLEGALFASGKPLSMERMEEIFGYTAVEIRASIRRVVKKLEDMNSALRIEEISKDTYVLCLASEYEDLVKPLIKSTKSGKGIFNDPLVMEMITNIAYRQPISTSLLSKIMIDTVDIPTQRKIIADLLEQRYIEKIEKRRSVRLKVTDKFMDDFGFSHDSRKMKLQILWRLKRGK